jgi:nitroimidazol reductase NimA-like FMN-containing flavoprotein (pyridoxamine 5'-phosphate oxidase superfamily)
MVNMERTEIIETFNDPVAQELLRSAIPARLAYVGMDGTPRVIPIAFYWTGGEIVVCTSPTSPKARALRANPHIALTLDTERAPWTQLLVRGKAEIEIVDGIPPEYLKASEKGMPEEQWDQFAEQVRAMYPQMARIRIVPTWAKVFDFSTGRVPAFLQRLAAERARREEAAGFVSAQSPHGGR